MSVAFPDQLQAANLAGVAAFARACFASERADFEQVDRIVITVESHDGVDVVTYEWQQRGIPVGGMSL